MQLAIFIPAFNEAASIGQMSAEIEQALGTIAIEWCCIICDDGSDDDTAAIMQQLQISYPWLFYLRNEARAGKSHALYKALCDYAPETCLFMDGDLQQCASDIPSMLEKFQQDQLDVLVGWRQVRKDPLAKKLISQCYNAMTRWLFHSSLHDHDCGMLMIKYAVFKKLLPEEPAFQWHRFIVAMAASLRFRVGETPVQHRERLHGSSKYTLSRYIAYARDIPVAKRHLRNLKTAARQ